MKYSDNIRKKYLSKFLASKVSGLSVAQLDSLVKERKLKSYKVDRYGDKLCINEVLKYKDSILKKATEVKKENKEDEYIKKTFIEQDSDDQTNTELEFAEMNKLVNKHSFAFSPNSIYEYILINPENINLYKITKLFSKTKKRQYVIYKKPGVKLTKERIENKKHPPLYIHESEQTLATVEVINGCNERLEKEISYSDIEPIKEIVLNSYEHVFFHPIKEVITALQETMKILVDGYLDYKDIVDKLYSKFIIPNSLFEHVVNVMNLSLKFCVHNNYPPENTMAIGLSALLHDIGKSQIQSDLLKSTELLSHKDRLVYKAHTLFGYRILGECIFDNPNIKYGALEHHENIDGSGYPRGTKKTSFFGQLIAIINQFDMIIIKAKEDKKTIQPVNALKILKANVDKEKLNADLFKQFAYSLL